jgi:hypothetical protein
MTAYECKHCPLAFQVGYYGYWDLSGCCSQYVCCECGTMHRIDHRDSRPDVLFAQPGPILAMIEVTNEDYAGQKFSSPELPIAEDSWRRVGELPTSPELQRERIFPNRVAGVRVDQVACSCCGRVGRLVLDVGHDCPKCGEKLDLVYVDTIN